ncbi:GNAT family N-acetyltransferase [Halobacteriales archaeon QS_1_68_17]|nr:MAG: GNAT family N-acetyltransferase [Halobacteriales archaeon QS_1_68_17]
MSGPDVTLRRADEDEDEDGMAVVETLLARNDLPTGDVRGKADCFYVGYRGDSVVGIGGVERFERSGLLRSIVVERSARGAGFGTALCDELETRAAAAGVERLYLLTTTAAGFFADRGYAEIERADAPDSIRETAQFSEYCPATATCMRKHL